jgi:hypothetical protein
MKLTFTRLVRHTSSKGAALIMTVIILAMITIMVLGFADLVRYETVSSSAHQERARAQLFARMGVDIVTGVLRRETADSTKTWASMPGALIVPDMDASPPRPTRLAKQVNLHSGLPSTALMDAAYQPAILRPANLNIQTFADQAPPTHLITDQAQNPADPASPAVRLPLRWVYVRQDGTLDYSETPDLTLKGNPLVGRFAYWTDDESSKINLNTAWKRNPPGTVPVPGVATNTFSPSHPTSINLASISGLNPTMVDQLHAKITPNHLYTDLASATTGGRFFNSTREVRVLGEDFTTAFNAAKFEVTHYNHDPDSTFFNEPRIVLTTQKKHAKGRPFLDILTNPGTETALGADPGTVGNISAAKLNTVILGDPTATPPKLGLVDYLKRTDWPMVSGTSSFQQKYYQTTTSVVRLTQLALNIIDYVRSAESNLTLVEPIRGIVSGGKFVCDVHDTNIRGQENTYKGLTRSLYVTEMGAWVKNTAESGGTHAGRFQYKFFAEVHLPRNCGVSQLNLMSVDSKRLYVYINAINVASSPTFFSDANVNLQSKWFRVDRANIVGGNPILNEGGYATLVFTAYRQTATRPTKVNMRTAIVLSADKGITPADPGTSRLDVTPVGDPAKTDDLVYTLDDGSVTETTIKSLQTDDPLVNAVPKDFSSGGHLANTFGLSNSRNSVVAGLPADNSIVPQQDTDSNGKLSAAGMYLPYPRGHAKNPNGVVQSPGELGHIHTGIEVTSTAAKGGVPWRTLRLQPNKQVNTIVPDWAFMDLFTVPIDVPPLARGIFAPHDTTTAGRVNMNSQTQPYGNPLLFPTPLERRRPLVALLTGVTKDAAGTQLTTHEAEDIASNIYFRTFATTKFGKSYGSPTTYDSPGEVVEVEGVADKGEESEAVVRGIANLICARGSVFNVYTIGQSLTQTRGGELKVTAEQRQLTLIERYDRDVNPTVADIHFRKAAFQHLNP